MGELLDIDVLHKKITFVNPPFLEISNDFLLWTVDLLAGRTQ